MWKLFLVLLILSVWLKMRPIMALPCHWWTIGGRRYYITSSTNIIFVIVASAIGKRTRQWILNQSTTVLKSPPFLSGKHKRIPALCRSLPRWSYHYRWHHQTDIKHRRNHGGSATEPLDRSIFQFRVCCRHSIERARNVSTRLRRLFWKTSAKLFKNDQQLIWHF